VVLMAAYEHWGAAFWDGIDRTSVVFEGHPMDRNIGDWARGDDVPGFYCWAKVAYYQTAHFPLDHEESRSIICFSDPDAAMLFRLRWC
jgi:hypothetical protein